ncbi:uncharacterized protein C8Q71DRAFT_854724 [Rhodofomes roseus]|uniref:Uncharacterized protein n=1 Tax=Rhodofomes roseus TaxID=34475 RepID=A0ABQ8KSR0_9APHY|nr:uncharacterized protein C8Q71DRAFT_854724 [Rhodofomes roseus]KAH9840866.1 hypothetical protein C8Q71DRAFT_854724 [Rhodofomes roseus]
MLKSAETHHGFSEFEQPGLPAVSAQTKFDTYQQCTDDISYSSLNLKTLNGSSDYTANLAAIGGFANANSNLVAGTVNYAYIGGSQASPNAPAQSGANSFTAASGTVKPYESDIWTIDPTTGAVTAQWVNTDGSTPKTYFAIAQNVVILTADLSRYAISFGSITAVSVTFVQLSSSVVPVTTTV